MLNNTSTKPFTRSDAKKAKEQEVIDKASATSVPLRFAPLTEIDRIVQDWEKWKGKVSGSETMIKEGLYELNREPKDARELNVVIHKQLQKKMAEVLEEAEAQQNYCPW